MLWTLDQWKIDWIIVYKAAHSNVTWWRSGNLQIQSYKDGQVITDGGIQGPHLIDNARI